MSPTDRRRPPPRVRGCDAPRAPPPPPPLRHRGGPPPPTTRRAAPPPPLLLRRSVPPRPATASRRRPPSRASAAAAGWRGGRVAADMWLFWRSRNRFSLEELRCVPPPPTYLPSLPVPLGLRGEPPRADLRRAVGSSRNQRAISFRLRPTKTSSPPDSNPIAS